MANFCDVLIASLAFSSNIVLWMKSDYFSTDASLQVLLHTWSLAIEEQFYLFLPVLLVFCPVKQ